MDNLSDPHLHLEHIERHVSARCYREMTFNVIKSCWSTWVCVRSTCTQHWHCSARRRLHFSRYTKVDSLSCSTLGSGGDIHILRLEVLDGDVHIGPQNHIYPHHLEFKALQKTGVREGRRPKCLRQVLSATWKCNVTLVCMPS